MSESRQVYNTTSSLVCADVHPYVWETLENMGTVTFGTATAVAFGFNIAQSAVNLRLKIGSWYVWGTVATNGGSAACIAYLPNGTHPVIMETKKSSTQDTALVSQFQAGPFKLKDENVYGTATVFTTGANTNEGTFTVTIPVRKTPIGTITNTAVFVSAYGTRMWGGTAAECQFANTGDSLIGSVALKINGSQVDWTDRCHDSSGTSCAWAYYLGTLPLGETGTVTFYKGTETMLHMNVYASPWLLPGTVFHHLPVDLDFPPGSTFYAMLEPLAVAMPTTGILQSYIGRRRCVSLGTASDYYDVMQTPGSVIATHNYTFEIVDPNKIDWEIATSGTRLFGCVSHIGVDIR